MQKATLSNGLKVVLAESHSAPVVNFALIIPGGYSSDTTDSRGTAGFAQRMLEDAIFGMLPKSKMGKQMYRKLKVYAGDKHPHQAQQPVAKELVSKAS